MCGLKGHVTPGAHVARITPRDAGIAVELPGGRRFVRCLRCDSWLDVAPPQHPEAERLPPVEHLQVPVRDEALRDLIVLRLIALDRAVHVVVFSVIAGAVLFLYAHLAAVRRGVAVVLPGVERALRSVGFDAAHSPVTRELHNVERLHGRGLLVIGGVAIAYAVLEAAEGVGLWMQRRWAEYLTAVATAGFVPFEIKELLDRVTALRVAALVINLAILVYLVWAKRLFGIRGGAAALEHRRRDPRELFGPPHTVIEGRAPSSL